MKNVKPYFPLRDRQKAVEPAVNRIRSAQSFPIQWPTLLKGRIFQIVLVLLVVAFAAQEVYAADGSEPSTASPTEWRRCEEAAYSTKGTLITDASGYRNRTSGGLNNVGSNGNFWSFAPNSQTNARNLNFNSGNVNPLNNNNRANGFSVRPSRALGVVAGSFHFDRMRYTYDEIHSLVTFAYLKAREKERATDSQVEFEVDLEKNISDLARELYRREWFPQPLDWFVNLEPTVREVFAPKFRDRVVSHVLFMMISPIFERYFVYDSFSCRVGKGTLVGIERLEHHIRSVTDNYRREAFILNYDIKAYFMSIVRSRLYDIIRATLAKHQRRFPDAIDYDFADWLIRTVIVLKDPLEGCVYHGDPALIKLIQPGKSLRDQPPGVGIPIGDVQNQLCSNIYLNVFDWFILLALKVRHAVRYVDDGKMLHRSYAYLEDCWGRSEEFLKNELELTLHPLKTQITSTNETTFFLGAAIKPYRRYATNEAVTRMKQRFIEIDGLLADGTGDTEQLMARINSHLGYMSHFDEKKMIAKALANAPHILQYFDISKDLTKATVKTI